MIVEIFVAQRDRGDALSKEDSLVVNGENGVPRVWDHGVESVEEPRLLGNLPEQKGAGIGRQPATHEVGDQRVVTEGRKLKSWAVTVCHSGGLAVLKDGA